MPDSAAPIPATSVLAEVIDDGTVSGQQVLVVGLCMLLNMLDGFDITAMAIVAGAVSQELQLTPDRLGLIFSFALAGMMAGAMFLAPVSDIIGRRKLILLSVALVGVSILLTGTATTLGQFFVLRFISGLGAGAILACQATLAAEYSPERVRGFAVAVTTAGYPLGAMMTSVVAGFIMPAFGWRGMFWFGGVLTLALGVAAWTLLPESLKYLLVRRPANALQRANSILRRLGKDTLPELPATTAQDTRGGTGFVENIRSLLGRDHRVATLRLWTIFFLCLCTMYFLMSWIPLLMEESGFSERAGRLAFLLFNLGGVVGTFVLGGLSTRRRLTDLVSFFIFSSGVSMVIFASAPRQLTLLLVVTFLMGMLLQGGFTGLYGVAAKVYPTRIRSTGVGWAIGLGRSGAVVGPAAAGFLIAAGLTMSATYYIFAVPVAIGGLMAYWLRVN